MVGSAPAVGRGAWGGPQVEVSLLFEVQAALGGPPADGSAAFAVRSWPARSTHPALNAAAALRRAMDVQER